MVRQQRDLLTALHAARQELLDLLTPLEPRHLNLSIAPGDRWTVADILYHLAAWDQVGAQTVTELATNQPVSQWIGDVDGWNEATINGRPPVTLDALLDFLTTARRAMMDALTQAPSTCWTERSQSQPITVPELCRTWTRHDREHADQLRAFWAEQE